MHERLRLSFIGRGMRGARGLDLVDVIARSHARWPNVTKTPRCTAASAVKEENRIISGSDVPSITKPRGVAVDSPRESFDRDEARHATLVPTMLHRGGGAI